MVDVAPIPKSEGDRVLLLEAAVTDLQQWRAARASRDTYIVSTLIGLAGVLAVFVVAYVH